jgi:hypothetical protein
MEDIMSFYPRYGGSCERKPRTPWSVTSLQALNELVKTSCEYEGRGLAFAPITAAWIGNGKLYVIGGGRAWEFARVKRRVEEKASLTSIFPLSFRQSEEWFDQCDERKRNNMKKLL